MSTFVLLTITGLGLGAMYFLIASGLSLIYGLMGVLNFAHGAFITVGAYATWWTPSRSSTAIDSAWPRFLLSVARRARRSARVFAALVELVLIRPLYLRHIEQVLVTVGLVARVRRARRRRSGGPTRSRSPCRAGCTRRRPSCGAHDPERPLGRDRDRRRRARRLLELFLRCTRYGLIIRAGVENRAMVTALGIDVRKAFTLVFAIGGVAAALAGVLAGVYFSDDRPEPGHAPADLRVHRRRDRRPRLDRRLGGRRRRRRPRPAVRELLRVVGHRRPRRSCLLLAVVAARPARAASPASGGARIEQRVAPASSSAARRASASLALVPKSRVDIPELFDQRRSTARARSQLLAPRCSCFGGLALTYDLLSATPACSRSATRSTSRSASTSPTIAMTEWHWSFWPALALHRAASGSSLPLVLGAVSLRVERDRVRDGDARVRAGGLGARRSRTRTTGPAARRASASTTRSCPTAFVGIFNTKNLYWLALGYLVVVFVVVRWAVDSSPGRVWQAIRENELRVEVLGLRPFRYKLMAFVLASFLADGRRRSSTCC